MASKTLIVNFVGDSKNLEQSIKRSTDQLGAFGKAGNALKNVAGYAVATAGIYGIAEAVRSVVSSTVSFQSSMTRIQTQAGASADQVKKLGDGVLALSGQVGVAPTTLADGMYHVVSSLNATVAPAKRVSTELAVLKTAAEGARVGGANLVDVTNALDAAVVSGIPGTQNFQKAMGALNATVGAGDMSMQDLADAFGTGLLGPMKTFGVSLQDISAALAVFGDNNIRGQDAATKLSSAIRIMAAPSKQAAGALSTIGLSSLQLANDIRNNGLVSAFEDLKTHLTDSGKTATQQAAVITAAFGGRQSTGVNLLLNQMDRLKAKYKEVGAGANSFAGDVTKNNKTFSQEFAQVGAQLQAFGIRIGDAVLPLVTKMIPAIQSALTWVVRLFDQFKAGVGVGGQVRDILVDIGNKIAQAVTPIIKALEPEIQATVTLFTNLFDLFTSQISSSSGSTGISAATRVFAGLGTAIRVMSVPITAVMNGLSGLLGFLRQNQTVLVAVEGAVAGAAAAFVAYKVAVVATTVASTVAAAATTAFAVAQGVLEIALLATESPMLALSVAWGVLTAAMDANPLVAVVAAIGILGGALVALELKTHFLEAAWAAIKPAFQAVANWITTAAGNIVSAVTGAWDTIKTKTSSIFNSVLGFVKSYWPELLGVFTFGMGTVVGLVIQNWGTIKQTTMDVWNAIKGFVKQWWPELLGVMTLGIALIPALVVKYWGQVKSVTMDVWNAIKGFIKQWWPEMIGIATAGVGTIVGLIIQHWGAIKSKTSSVFNSIKGIASDIWQAISGAITGAVSGAVNKVKTTIGGLTGWLVTAWGNIKTGVSSFASSIASSVVTAVGNAINAVIGFLDSIIKVLNDIPFVKIKPIDKIPLPSSGGGSGGGGAGSGGGTPHTAGFYQGGMVNKPTYMVGEEAPTHPEIVLASNPAYRQRNLGLWHQAGSMLGVPGFAKGGVPGQGGNVWQVRTSAEESASGDGWTELSTNGNAAAASGNPQTATGSPGNFSGGFDFATLGHEYPHGTMLNIQANGRSGTFPLTDVGDGSSFAPAIGLTPAVQAALGGMPTTADIQMADGSNMQVAPGFGTLVSGTAHGGSGTILSKLAGIPGDVLNLLESGAKALIGEFPKLSSLPSWLQGLGSGILDGAGSFAKDKASSILSAIASTVTGGGGGGSPVPPPPSGKMPYAVQKALYAAKTLAARDEPYVTGGYGFDAPGLDCSGYVSTVLNYAGLGTAGGAPGGYMITGPLKTWGAPGDGKWITVGVRGADSGPGGHTMMAIDGQYFESSGHFAGGGPHVDSGWSEDFPIRRHPPGLATGGIIGQHPQLSMADYHKLLGGDMSMLASYNPDHASWFGGGNIAKAKAKQKATPKPKSRNAGRSKPKRGNGKAPNQRAAGILGPNGPLPFNDSDLTGLNTKLGAIFALDGGNGGLGVGPDGATTQLSALISTNTTGTGSWSDDILFPPPNFGTLPDYSQFVVIPDQLADGTQPPATLSPNINGVSSKLGQVIGWEQGWVGDLNQTTNLSKLMAKPIETAINRRVDQIAKIKKRVEANLAKIKALNKQISDNQGALANLKNLTPPVANPKTKAEHKRNQDFQANLASMRSQIAGRISGLQKQVTPLEAENMTLTGSKTAGGSKGELNSIQTQLGVPGAGASSLSAAEGGGGTSSSGLYALQSTVGGWPGMINSTGGDLDVQRMAEVVYKTQLANLQPQAQAAVDAANSNTTPSSGGGGTSTTGESPADQVKDQMIEALGLRARSAEALLKAEVPIPGFATGGIPFGGWFGTGGDITASQPTLIGIGDGPGTETASIRRQGQGSGGDETHVHMHWAPGMEVFKDMVTAVVETREQGQVRNANRRLPGAGGGFTRFGR